MNEITLTAKKIHQILGIEIADQEVERIFTALKFAYKREKNHWLVSIPSYRFDITIPEDLIEEIARLYGYDKIPTHQISGQLVVNKGARRFSRFT